MTCYGFPLTKFGEADKHVCFNRSQLTKVGPRFFALLFVLDKKLSARGTTVTLLKPSAKLRLRFRFHGVGYLCEHDSSEWA